MTCALFFLNEEGILTVQSGDTKIMFFLIPALLIKKLAYSKSEEQSEF